MFDIRNATHSDSSGIIKIIDKHLIVNKKEKSSHLESQGFLKCPHTIEDIQSFILNHEKYLVLVAESHNQISGFAICCDIKMIPNLQPYLAALPQINNSSKIFYLKQIAKIESVKGVGPMLMQSILQHANLKNYHYVVSQIVHSPVKNKRSIQFHVKSGFEHVSVVEEKGYSTGVYLKEISQ